MKEKKRSEELLEQVRLQEQVECVLDAISPLIRHALASSRGTRQQAEVASVEG